MVGWSIVHVICQNGIQTCLWVYDKICACVTCGTNSHLVINGFVTSGGELKSCELQLRVAVASCSCELQLWVAVVSCELQLRVAVASCSCKLQLRVASCCCEFPSCAEFPSHFCHWHAQCVIQLCLSHVCIAWDVSITPWYLVCGQELERRMEERDKQVRGEDVKYV